MNRTRHQHTILSAALLTLILAAPASAADLSGPTRGSWWATARQGLALALAGWFGPSSGWSAAWGEEGHGLDPDGRQQVSPPPPAPPWTAAWGEDGSLIDPDGRKVSPPPPIAPASAISGIRDDGSLVDPNG